MPRAVTRHSLAWLTCILVLPLYTASASAAEGKSGRKIEEVIVTAERREASIQDTSISITAFTGQFLQDFGIRNQEDLQNYIPATTIQPYDATVRGVGRNFRALGGDPGVSTYMNGIYSEDLLTATDQTFFDVERIEVLRGPQGTLYGRNAVGGAINILYKEPTFDYEGMVKGIAGNFDNREGYLALSGPLIDDTLAGRVTYAHRERDGVIDNIGLGDDLDGLGTDTGAGQLKWNVTDSIQMNVRVDRMRTKRSFGGANGAGLVVLNEEGNPYRNTTNLVPGYRFIDTSNTDPANVFDSTFYDSNAPILTFNDPQTGQPLQAQHNRAGIDYGDFDGFQNAAASLDSFNNTSPETAAKYNACVFPNKIDGNDVCAATNGYNKEFFTQSGVQFNTAWDVNERLSLKYLFGFNELSYKRITDDDNTASLIHDRQFYVNHEAIYRSHELQAFFEPTEKWSFTSGIFFYNAKIDQRGDFYSSVAEAKYRDPYVDNTGLAGAIFPGPMVDLFSARRSCVDADVPAPSCAPNYAVKFTNEELAAAGAGRNDNLQLSQWLGDDGTNRALDVIHGPKTAATDLLYTTQTERDAFAAYTQAVYDINTTFSLTLGLRYAQDQVTAQENLFRYSEILGAPGGVLDSILGPNSISTYNLANGGIVDSNGDGVYEPTPKAVNGGIPVALSVYRPFVRTDSIWDWRINLDQQINQNLMLYYSATKGHRSGGFNLVFFSQTPTYDPEELVSYEIGYKSDWLDNTLQLNGAVYYYDYQTIHTVVEEVSSLGGLSNSVLEAPGGTVYGTEAELTWLATDALTLGGNFSYTPSEYDKSLIAADLAPFDRPDSLFPDPADLTEDIKGNKLIQVPEWKYTAWGSYRFMLPRGSHLDALATWSYTGRVYYSPFQKKAESAAPYGRLDLRATWQTADNKITVSAFVNNVFDDVGDLQVLREGEAEFFRHTAGTTVPRHFGVEFSYAMGNY